MFTVRFNNLLNIEHEGFKHKVIEDAVLNSFWLTVHKWRGPKKKNYIIRKQLFSFYGEHVGQLSYTQCFNGTFDPSK